MPLSLVEKRSNDTPGETDRLAPPVLGFDLRHLRCFIVLAEEMHFSRAAAVLDISQPYLYRLIRDLERVMGTPLFNRQGKAVTLTEAGGLFLNESKRILDHVSHSVKLVRQVICRQTGQPETTVRLHPVRSEASHQPGNREGIEPAG